MESIIRMRNKCIHWLYENIVRNIAFQFEAEDVHNFFIKIGVILGKFKVTKRIVSDMFYYENSVLKQNVLGIDFRNPVGLSAGFDKNAEIISICEDVGFGFSEVGSITKLEHKGNKGKRLDRLKNKKSLWVNFGLNNKSTDKISSFLDGKKYKIPFGVNIAKSNYRETADDKIGRDDYIYSLKKFNEVDTGSFYVLNISCPNAYGGQPFSRDGAYESLLRETDKLKIRKPIFVKLSPDMSKKETDKIIEISNKHKISGFIIANLTKSHDIVNGGVSGKLVEQKSNKMLKYVYQRTKGKYVLVGVGGIFSAEDAYRKIKLGASLVELITGMIYEGPNLISEINQGLVELLKKDGFKSIGEAVGADVK